MFVLMVFAITASLIWLWSIKEGFKEYKLRHQTSQSNRSYVLLTIVGILSFGAAGFFWGLSLLFGILGAIF